MTDTQTGWMTAMFAVAALLLTAVPLLPTSYRKYSVIGCVVFVIAGFVVLGIGTFGSTPSSATAEPTAEQPATGKPAATDPTGSTPRPEGNQPSPTPLAPTDESATGIRVIDQPEQPANAYEAPSLGSRVISTLQENDSVTLLCSTQGDRVAQADGTSSELWYRTDQGFMSDVNLKTNSNGSITSACPG